ncbi:MAG: imidazoleglycerol-phosphate dehydratase HisB [Planctomycetaceae bacterium]|jgi:imidazoleglycerol-phosphate dehydratase|nr:imidazoleglycerol-phosphate dehydratase HisB [Planctomycetaceae bacterium]
MRKAVITRKTRETEISLALNLDGSGQCKIASGIGFFDHMLELFSAHSLIDLEISADGDFFVDKHHTVEDVGIVLGQGLAEAMGDKSGINRYGYFTLPMDETLATSVVDFSGRPAFVYNVNFATERIGDFDTELLHEFWQGLVNSAACTLHLQLNYGTNGHHIAEAIFKCTARAIRMAIEKNPRQKGIPSTKGKL